MGVIFLLYLTSKPTVRTNFPPSIMLLYPSIKLFSNAVAAGDLTELKGVPAEMLVKLVPSHARKQCTLFASS